VAAAGKPTQLLRGLRPPGRLGEEPLFQRQRLIRADDKLAGLAYRYRTRFFAREQRGDVAGRRKSGSLLNGPLVDRGRNGFKVKAGIGEQGLPRTALGSKDQRIISAPKTHLESRVIPEAAAARGR
jgi:hypothetical protein